MLITFQVVSCTQAQPLVELLRQQLNCRAAPIFVVLDGHSGSGKSTIASIVADELNSDSPEEAIVTVIEGDQFYGGGSASTWDAMSVDQKIDRVIDWRRQRLLLKSLRNQGTHGCLAVLSIGTAMTGMQTSFPCNLNRYDVLPHQWSS